MVSVPEGFIFVFPAIYGLLVGIVELVFVHADESGMHWLRHGLHTLPWCIIFSYASLNAWQLAVLFPFEPPAWMLTIAIPVVLGFITMIKVKFAAQIAKGSSIGEHWWHALVIGALVGAAPFVYWLLSGASFLPAILLK